jgi:hypothetical protein
MKRVTRHYATFLAVNIHTALFNTSGHLDFLTDPSFSFLGHRVSTSILGPKFWAIFGAVMTCITPLNNIQPLIQWIQRVPDTFLQEKTADTWRCLPSSSTEVHNRVALYLHSSRRDVSHWDKCSLCCVNTRTHAFKNTYTHTPHVAIWAVPSNGSYREISTSNFLYQDTGPFRIFSDSTSSRNCILNRPKLLRFTPIRIRISRAPSHKIL